MLSVKGAGGSGLEIKNGGSVDITALSDEIDVGNFVSCSSGEHIATNLDTEIYYGSGSQRMSMRPLNRNNKFVMCAETSSINASDTAYIKIFVYSADNLNLTLLNSSIVVDEATASTQEYSPKLMNIEENKFLLVTSFGGTTAFMRFVEIGEDYDINVSDPVQIYTNTTGGYKVMSSDMPLIKLENNKYALLYTTSDTGRSYYSYLRFCIFRIDNNVPVIIDNTLYIRFDGGNSDSRKSFNYTWAYEDNGEIIILAGMNLTSQYSTYPQIYKVSNINSSDPTITMLYSSSDKLLKNGVTYKKMFVTCSMYSSHISATSANEQYDIDQYLVENGEVIRRTYPYVPFFDTNVTDEVVSFLTPYTFGTDDLGNLICACRGESRDSYYYKIGYVCLKSQNNFLIYDRCKSSDQYTRYYDIYVDSSPIFISESSVVIPISTSLFSSGSNRTYQFKIIEDGLLKATKYTDDEPCYGIVTKKITSTSGTIVVPTID